MTWAALILTSSPEGIVTGVLTMEAFVSKPSEFSYDHSL